MITAKYLQQRGLSLIELLIALAISSLLILGITQVYIDNKSNYLFQQGVSDNIENARYTLLAFEEELYRTGYRARPDDAFENAFRAAPSNCGAFVAGETIKFNANEQLLCVRYQPSIPGITACDGVAMTTAAAPYSTAVAPVIVELQISDNSLTCNGVTLIDNVEDFRFEFGLSGPSGERQAEEYVSDPDAGAAIYAVRYAALIKSRSTTLANDNNSIAYQSWREKWYDESAATAPDRALYLVAESVISLRNLTR